MRHIIFRVAPQVPAISPNVSVSIAHAHLPLNVSANGSVVVRVTDNHQIYMYVHTIVCVLPVGSCSNERSFSRMKCTKTRLRNALGEEMLEWILITQDNGPKRITNEQTDTIQKKTRIE